MIQADAAEYSISPAVAMLDFLRDESGAEHPSIADHGSYWSCFPGSYTSPAGSFPDTAIWGITLSVLGSAIPRS